MSNVFARFHKPTGLEFFDNAVQIGIDVTRFVMNPAHIPKRYTYTHAVPIVKRAERLNDLIVAANSVYPSDEKQAERRRELQQEAINANEMLLQALQRLIYVRPEIDVNQLERIGQQIMRESDYLRGWRNKTKVLKEK